MTLAAISPPVYGYLFGAMATAVAVLTSVWFFVVHRRRAMELDVLEQRLPDAARYEDLHHRLAETEQEFQGLRDDLLEAQAVIHRREEAEKWLRENEEALHSVKAEREQQERLRAELEELQRCHAQEYEQSKALRGEVESAVFNLGKLRDESQHLEPKVQAMRSEETNLRRSLDGLAGETAKLEELTQAWCDKETQARADLGRVRGELDMWEKKLNDVVAEHTRLTAEIAGLEAAAKRLEVRAGKDEHRLADLWHPVLKRDRFKGTMPTGEAECLRAVHQYMEGLGLHFSDRVLQAFHTSLKVAEISPLVVLAGISGTGKSELPRRYAEGMGMHFLNIAVQPGWDSPQDMFGFYNYMEGRYRATELARALIQMDPFHAEAERGWEHPSGWQKNSASDQMLLVLLDEMNLARIEYYFSEFLSRLEIRRGIERANPSDRRKAEIPLEVGGTGGEGSILYLFTHSNVLFVGTMNEDETTQALSDKVVDRANVLHFGRPRRLTRPIAVGGSGSRSRACVHEAWAAWIRNETTLNPGVRDNVDQWTQRLNDDVMAPIHRPFAYRTHLAIRTYVANYPDASDAGAKAAMADQIEQKILPKFRGLDATLPNVARAIDALYRLLQELEDTQLIEAIDESRQTEEHLFDWHGIDREAERDR